MKTEIILIRRGWVNVTHGDVSVWVRGQAHIGDEYLDTVVLAERFSSVVAKGLVDGLDDLVSRLNGNWAAVVVYGDNVYLAVDHLRSIQLLYRQENDVLHVFDDMETFRKDHQLEFDEDCVHEYLSSGYVYGNRTLFKETYSLQAAERAAFVAGRIDARRYWRYIPNIDKPIVADDALVERIDKTFEAAMRRLVESVGGKRIVVPLSGGYDSRLIVNYLYKLGVRDVLCYTYGVKGNGESACSREIASRLGYEWHYVEYTKENQSSVVSDSRMHDYFRYMSNGVNRPCVQEYLALLMLRENKQIIPGKDVIVPGYYLDVLAGSKIKTSTRNCTAVSNSLEDENNFFLQGFYMKAVDAIKSIFYAHSDVSAKAFFETFLWQERLAKFIVNNVRCYEWLGFEWRLPVCDRQLFDLWLSLPYSMRYARVYFRSIFPQLSVSEIRDVPVYGCGVQLSFLRRIKHHIGQHTPYVVKYALDGILRRMQVDENIVSWFTCLDGAVLIQKVVAAFPCCEKRLSSVGRVANNAAISLKALTLEMSEV